VNKKITSSIIAALIMAGSTSLTAFAAMGDGSVVIGSKAFSLEYSNDKANFDEISAEVVKGGAIYVKDFNGKWINNLTGLTVEASLLPAVVYKDANGTTSFDAQDKDSVENGTTKVTSVSLNKITDILTVGGSDTLTPIIAPSNAANNSVTWTTSNSSVATVINGEVTAVASGTTNITATTVDGSKTSNCTVTVNNKKGYVYNQEITTDLKIRSTASLSGTILGQLYNYEKVEILGTSVDTSGNVWDKINYNNSAAYVFDPYIQHYTSPADNVVLIAKNITKQFEVGSNDQVAGNFDGQGLSLGDLQWCIRQGTLQPLLNRMDREYTSEMQSTFGTNYTTLHAIILNSDVTKQLEWAIGINDTNNKIVAPWYSQFVSLSNNQDFIKIEEDAQVYTVKQAMIICDKYKLNTVRGFSLAFDIVNQNGGLSAEATKTIDIALVQTPNMTEKNLLEVIANAVADSSANNSEDIRSREMAIVNGQGTVHNITLNLDANYGLSDTNWR